MSIPAAGPGPGELAATAPAGEGRLVRGIGLLDSILLTIGSVIGTGIFLTSSDMAKVLPSGTLILLVWLLGGLWTLAGALTYAELGVMFPRAGGLYVYLREAYGPLPAFLFGWTSFLVIMTGGIAALAVAFGQYLGGFAPWFSTANVVWTLRLGGFALPVNGVQVAAVAVILLLTAINHIGVEAGNGVQSFVSALKVVAIVALAGVGLLAPFGVAMIAALWTYDGWYGLTCSAGEVRDPARTLPRGLILGVAVVAALYLLLNVVYLRVLTLPEMAAAPRLAEAAAAKLFGPLGAQLVSAVVLVSTFGCLASTLLYSSRIYLPMAAEGLFFPALARIHPRYRTPVACLWAQSLWAILLTVSGSYEQLYTYVIFAGVAFWAAIAAAVFVLRRTRPEAPRPYRTWGYPLVPALFVLGSLLLLWNTLAERPRESLAGLAMLLLGLPAYAYFRWRQRTAGS